MFFFFLIMEWNEWNVNRVGNKTYSMKVTMCKKRKFSLVCPWSRFSWVSGMKVRDDLGCISEFGSENP